MLYPENNQPNHKKTQALSEVIATVEAVFSLIRFSQLDQDIKEAFYRLEKQFDYYASQALEE